MDNTQKQEIEALKSRRAGLQEEISRIDEDIADLQGTGREKVAKVFYPSFRTQRGGTTEKNNNVYEFEPKMKKVVKSLTAENMKKLAEAVIAEIPEYQRGEFMETLKKMLAEENPEPPHNLPPAVSAPFPQGEWPEDQLIYNAA